MHYGFDPHKPSHGYRDDGYRSPDHREYPYLKRLDSYDSPDIRFELRVSALIS
jgi:hypothetical protein